MVKLNYNHLFYFWMVVQQGSLGRAARALHVTPSTVSSQIQVLERTMGEELFTRTGRRLLLTEAGRVVLHYAQEIFSLGDELVQTLQGRDGRRPRRLVVGIGATIDKLLVFQILEPVLHLPQPPRMVCRENQEDRLLWDLSRNLLDLVITSWPGGPKIQNRLIVHELGECGMAVFGHRRWASSLERKFPHSLTGAPMLLPRTNTFLRRALDEWLKAEKISPMIVGEFEGSGMMKIFGQAGAGLFIAPTAIEQEIMRKYNVHKVGDLPFVKQQLYLVAAEGKAQHPATSLILEFAREKLCC
jgi:LysR family transcriptional activator of nhaA